MLAKLGKLGRALMLPIAVMPAAALLLRFGQPDLLDLPWMASAGAAIFGNLPLLFAIGVAIGFADDIGTAALSAAVGYWVFTKVMVDISSIIYGEPGADVNMGVLAGILMGLTGAALYKRFHNIKLPEWLAFFGGKRFVPIITSFAALVLGAIFGVIWFWPGEAVAAAGEWAIGAGAVGAAAHAFLNRMLIPFGLHHVVNTIVWFEFGDLPRFFETAGAEGGIFMTGWFPIMMGGLIGAAAAMWRMAKPENRRLIGGIMSSAALASFITGITEPIEFAFMFVAPLLYVAHACLSAVSAFVTIELGMRSGFGFSAGVIDYVINFGIASHPLLLLLLTLVFFAIYYFMFVALIKVMNIPTPGREPAVVTEGMEK